MAAVTPICDFGWQAVDFALEGTDGKTYTLADVRGENRPSRGAPPPAGVAG